MIAIIKVLWACGEIETMDEPREYYAQWKKLVTKDHIVCDPIYLTCLEHANWQKLDEGFPGAGGRLRGMGVGPLVMEMF